VYDYFLFNRLGEFGQLTAHKLRPHRREGGRRRVPAEGSMGLPHVHGVVSTLAEIDEGGEGGLHKVEMPQLDCGEAQGIVEAMSHQVLAAWCKQVRPRGSVGIKCLGSGILP
jgi:hypothetical protein